MTGRLSSLQQVGLSLAACGALVSSGMTVAFPSVTKPSSQQTPWIGSASHLAMVFGSLAVGPAVYVYGCKAALTVALLLAFVGWSLLFGGGWAVGGRVLTGLSAGLSSAPVSVLIADTAGPSLRAALTSCKHAAFSTGLFLMYALGVIFKERWECSAMFSAGTSLVCLLAVHCWLPEAALPSRPKTSYRPFFLALARRQDVRRPFLVMATLSALKQFSGTTVVLSYAVELVRATGSDEPALGSVGVGAVRLAASLTAPLLASRYGRRPLASTAGYAASLALLVLAAGPPSPLLYILIYVFSSALSSSAIQALVGEVFLPEFRAVSTGLTTTASYASAFATLHGYPWMVGRLGIARVIGVYAVISVVCTLFTICFLKEQSHQQEQEEVADAVEEAGVPLQAAESVKV